MKMLACLERHHVFFHFRTLHVMNVISKTALHPTLIFQLHEAGNCLRHQLTASRLTLAILAMCLVSLVCGSVQAQADMEGVSKLDPRGQAMWNRHWPIAARCYIIFDEDYRCIRGYNERYPSSRSMTVTDLLRKDKGYVMRLRTWRGTTVEQRVNLSRAEAEAQAMALPEMAVGHYGYIHSVEVERILSPDAMIVRNVWLVDAQALYRSRDEDRDKLSREYDHGVASQLADEIYQHRVRLANLQDQPVFKREFVLQGFPTERLASGMRWSGPRDGGLQIALLSVRDIEDNWSPNQGRRRMLVATPVGRLRTGLNQEQFLDLLKKRGMTPKDLVDVVEEANRSVVRDVEKNMVDAIEAKAAPVAPPDDNVQ